MSQSPLKNTIDQDNSSNASNQFIRADGGKTKSNRLEVPTITLPQGTVNHILDSLTDIIANIFGILIGLLISRRWAVYVATGLGNQIPGPGDPDPTMAEHIGTEQYNTHKNPSRAWGQYLPPIGQPEPPRAP